MDILVNSIEKTLASTVYYSSKREEIENKRISGSAKKKIKLLLGSTVHSRQGDRKGMRSKL